ncbi:TraB/GumN family protein [Chitinophaga pinensis]
MADRIDSLLKQEHPLIAVGAAHLGARTGLIELLRQKDIRLLMSLLPSKSHMSNDQSSISGTYNAASGNCL